jgi:hypothetical protein
VGWPDGQWNCGSPAARTRYAECRVQRELEGHSRH